MIFQQLVWLKTKITNEGLTNCLEIGMRFTPQIVTNRKDLEFISSSWLKVLDHQTRFLGLLSTQITGSVSRVQDLILFLFGVYVALPTDVQAHPYALQVLDDGRRGSGYHKDAGFVRFHLLGDGLHRK